MKQQTTEFAFRFSTPAAKSKALRRRVQKYVIAEGMKKLNLSSYHGVDVEADWSIHSRGSEFQLSGFAKLKFDLSDSSPTITNPRPHRVKVGDLVTVSSFSFTNRSGGTGSSCWQYDEIWTGGPVPVRITKKFFDGETGWRYWAQATTPELEQYLKRNALDMDETVSGLRLSIPAFTLFISEHDFTDRLSTWKKRDMEKVLAGKPMQFTTNPDGSITGSYPD